VISVTRQLSLFAVVALVVILAACDGSGDRGSTTAGPPAATTSTERATMATVPDSTATTLSSGVTSTPPAVNQHLGGDRDSGHVDITGRWVVTEFMVDGEWHIVEFGRNAENELVVGANAEFEPWIDIGDDVRGYPGGCNEFGGQYSIDGNALSFEGMITLRACHPSDLEDALGVLAAEGVVRVDVEGESMTWSTADASLRFVRRSTPEGD